MDRLSSLMLRASFVWLLAGATAGLAMMADAHVPGAWRAWLAPTHAHMLFVGWFVQFAIGVAYWLLPRRRSPGRPLGYDERLAGVAVVALNVGLLARVVAEPAERSGHATDLTFVVQVGSGLAQVAALGLFVAQLWPRVAARASRRTTDRGA